jgi:Holliday junction resolvasome RuvABC DNA-binding subunit
MELKDKLHLPVLDTGDSPTATVAANVRDALIGLGYSADEVRDALRNVPKGASEAEALRHALSLMGSRRA